MKKSLTIALLIVALVGLVGCTSVAQPTPATTPSSGSGSTGAGSATAVSIANMAFSPDQVTIKVGDTVTWTNNDSVPHTVTGSDFDSGQLAPGATFTHTFAAAGTFDYKCTIHPTMLAKVTVE
jgi:plastocyanin